VARKPTATYSGGMRRRLDLAMSLMLNPAIVFLDEPTTGVDPRGRAVMWDIVRGLAEQGTTIFLTTQYLGEADQLASRVAVIDGGSITADGTPTELKRRVGSSHLVLELPTPDALAAAARMLPAATVDSDALSLRVAGSTDANTIRETLVRLDDAHVSMAIARSSVLAGHVYGGTILITVSIAALLGFALLLGHRPQADALDWLALAGLVAVVGFALAWLWVAFGLAAERPDTASNLPLLLMILPLLSGGFVPIESLPGWLQRIAEHQPFTPIIGTIRGLLAGAPEGRDAAWAVGWSIAIAVIGHVWSLWLYRRHAAPSMTRTAGVG
jgi:ABC-2 type transporter/ABC transporter